MSSSTSREFTQMQCDQRLADLDGMLEDPVTTTSSSSGGDASQGSSIYTHDNISGTSTGWSDSIGVDGGSRGSITRIPGAYRGIWQHGAEMCAIALMAIFVSTMFDFDQERENVAITYGGWIAIAFALARSPGDGDTGGRHEPRPLLGYLHVAFWLSHLIYAIASDVAHRAVFAGLCHERLRENQMLMTLVWATSGAIGGSEQGSMVHKLALFVLSTPIVIARFALLASALELHGQAERAQQLTSWGLKCVWGASLAGGMAGLLARKRFEESRREWALQRQRLAEQMDALSQANLDLSRETVELEAARREALLLKKMQRSKHKRRAVPTEPRMESTPEC